MDEIKGWIKGGVIGSLGILIAVAAAFFYLWIGQTGHGNKAMSVVPSAHAGEAARPAGR